MKRRDTKGISLRTIHAWLIIGATLLTAIMFLSTFQVTKSFGHLTETLEQQIVLRKAARELMDASDYLTEKVQRFTVNGDMRYVEEYFTEAFEVNRRGSAVEIMAEGNGTILALKKLQMAMKHSEELMEREYYAMKLVIEAKGYTEYPDILRSVALSPEDEALSPEDKMRLATEMVLDDVYYARKDEIRKNTKASLDELEQYAYDADSSALASFHNEMIFVRWVILLQMIGIFFMVWLTARLGIHPVLNAVDRIKADSKIPELGANEFRYLARAYNKMYDVYQKSIEHLNFKASHDELTGAYNRAGYELLLSAIDKNTTYMLLFDLDNFKTINDENGHEVGDKVLVKLVDVLKAHIRSDDYICRIGGDEFVVLMLHTDKIQQTMIASKVTEINRALADTGDGLPAFSSSVGIVHGTDVADAEDFFRKVDVAMYRAKQNGKQTYVFYEE